MTFPNIIPWNYRVVGSSVALRYLLLIQQCHPDILILVETCVHSQFIDKVRRRTQFSNCIVDEAIGFSGGI